MPLSMSAILDRAAVPTHEALQKSLKALKFRLSVDDSYVPFELAGYLPCTLNGEDGGLDIRFESSAAHLARFPELPAASDGRDTLITLRSGGDPREDVCVLMLAAALASEFGAIVHEAGKGIAPTEKLISRARALFTELD